jgi:hypothetical protein
MPRIGQLVEVLHAEKKAPVNVLLTGYGVFVFLAYYAARYCYLRRFRICKKDIYPYCNLFVYGSSFSQTPMSSALEDDGVSFYHGLARWRVEDGRIDSAQN